ncbi:MAG: aminoacyl-tRNA hydrolase [Bacteriovoracaceae bacterium]|nr:aminoacyl-tRNA hydrolase [Bacteriovoracaceae bacterium]
MIRLVVGLGNPGAQYELTRHNVAWLVMDSMKELDNANWKNKFKGEYTEIELKGNKCVFLKPQTFMNLSGESVQPLCAFYKITPSEILVVHDEVDLPFGQVGFKKGGGLAGHNGLKSIAQQLGTQDFLRLRVGVGRPVHGEVKNWVLTIFPKSEDHLLGKVLQGSADAIAHAIEFGFEKAASKFSKKNFLEG